MKALFVAWRSGGTDNGAWGPVGRLEHDGELYRFCYTHGARTRGFRPFPGMEDLESVYESVELLPLFANRLLSPSRPEYDAFLRWGDFDPGHPPDPIAILGVSEGIRQTDAIEVFPCPVPDVGGCYINKFFLHGVRWMPPGAIEHIARLNPNDKLLLMPDPCNAHDRNAVAVRTDAERMLIGYVPRYLALDVIRLLYTCGTREVELAVERVNPDAPLQNRVLCRMHACWPETFQPCSDEPFLPIPSAVRARCRS
ncbi:MAG: DNA-binding protein [Phycisphaerales bacterium]|nr:DNA-binding protein [Phycisphaerales bacterium]